MPLFMAFINITKAYDMVNREAIWKLFIKYGVPPKVANIIRNLHLGMTGVVSFQEDAKGKFEIKNGLRQGCVIFHNVLTSFPL